MSLNTILATTPLTSTGYHLKATGTSIGNSLIWDNGTNVGIGNTNTSYTLDVSGTGRFTGAGYFGGATTASALQGAAELIVQNEIAVQCTDTTGPLLRMIAGSVNGNITLQTDAVTGTQPSLVFNVGAANRLNITSAGLIYNSNPPANDFAARFVGSTTTGQSFGLQVWGGTNSSDTAFRVLNASTSTEYFKIRGDGAATFSSIVGANIAPLANYGLTTKGLYGIWIQRNSVNDSGIEIYHDGTNSIINTSYQSTGSYGGMLIYTGGAQRMIITSAGNFDYGGFNTIGTNATYKQAFYGGFSIMWRGSTDWYFNSNHSYSSSNTNIATYTNSDGMGRLGCSGGSFSWGTYNGAVTAGSSYNFTDVFAITKAGVVTINNIGSGAVTATSGVLSTTSDMNLKIEDGYIDNALEKVMKLTPRYFYWKEESGLPTDLRQLGFYAQEVNETIGEEGSNTPKKENDRWGIYDRALIAMLTKGMQEQQIQIQNLQEQINILAK